MLEQIKRELSERILAGRISEIDRAVGRHIEVVCAGKRNAISSSTQRFHFATRVYCEQALEGIGNNKISHLIETQSKRTAMRVSKDSGLAAIGLKLNDPSV